MGFKYQSFFILMGVIFCPWIIIWAQPLSIEIAGKAGILINAETGKILFEKNAHVQLFPASTTKVATALFALKMLEGNTQAYVTAESESLCSVSEDAKRSARYKIPGYWLEPDGMHIGIKSGERMTFQSLLEGMLIPSGNDAANVIAQALGPGIPRFIESLNIFLKEIGCQNTVYQNPHGLHHPGHVTTAYDLAWMTKEALKNPIFCEIVSKTKYNRPKTNLQAAATFLQTNRLLRPGKYFYSKAVGVKTGYHSKAKKTFIGAAQLEGRTLIVVLLGYADHNAIFEEAIRLFETAFNQPKVEKIFLPAGPQTFALDLPHAKSRLTTYTDKNLSWEYYPAEDPQVKCYLNWLSLGLPIKKHQRVGELHLVAENGEVLKKVDLQATHSVKRAWPHNWIANLRRFFENHPYLSVFYLFVLAISFGLTCRSLRNV